MPEKTYGRFFLFFLFCHVLLYGRNPVLLADIQQCRLDLAEHRNGLRELSFDGIRKTDLYYTDDSFHLKVRKSASFWYLIFRRAVTPLRVHLTWKKSGHIAIRDRQHQILKTGDDAVLRVGLLVSGSAPLFPFFAPAWIRNLNESLLVPTAALHWYIIAPYHHPGEHWPSPYSEEIRMEVMASEGMQGWNQIRYEFQKPFSVSGFAFGADGDNTESSFDTWIKGLSIDIRGSQSCHSLIYYHK
ncbi:MAG: hypothetical protein H6618_09810 [Deltaproteobacteria bacterium]|nr:hypothetical protein [Deltaproteobacteria bacterium]